MIGDAVARGRSPSPGGGRDASRSPSPQSPGGAYSPTGSPGGARSRSRQRSRRNRKAVDQQLVCVPADAGPMRLADAGRIPQTYWLYGSFEFKMAVSVEQAMHTCFKKVDHLIERLLRWDTVPAEKPHFGMQVHACLPNAAFLALRNELRPPTDGGKRPLIKAVPPSCEVVRLPSGQPVLQRGMVLHRINNHTITTDRMEQDITAALQDVRPGADIDVYAGHEARGNLVFDVIATRKQIEKQSPNRLGQEIYRYVESRHDKRVATTFVGLTDNTARRVGRDVYCRSEELSPKKYDWDTIDSRRMFIIEPPDDILSKGPMMT